MGTAEGAESRGTRQGQPAPGSAGIVGYRALAAVYLALLLAPLVGALAPGGGVDIISWAFTVAGGLIGAGLGYVTAGRIAVRRWLTTLAVAVPLTVAPLGYVVWLFALFANNPGKTASTLILRPNTLGILATLPVAVALITATREATAYRIAQSTVHTEFNARTAQRTRRIQNWSMAGGLGAVAGFTAILYSNDLLDTATLLVLAVAIATFTAILLRTTTHSVVVTADGLAFDESFSEWDGFDGYEITDRSLVLSRASWFLADIAFDVDDIESLEEVQDALDQHLTEQS